MIIKDRVKGLCFVILCTAFLASATVSVELKELAHFVVEFYHNPAQVGAVAPCTAAVGTELTKYIAQFKEEHPGEPLRILEVGAGTGPIFKGSGFYQTDYKNKSVNKNITAAGEKSSSIKKE